MAEYKGDPKDQDAAKFATSMTGECLCGQVRVTMTKSNLFSTPNGHLCHCMNCRKFSGCVAANNLVLDKKNVQVEDPNGVIKVYNDSNTGSDGIARRSFCSNCGSPVHAVPTDSDEQYVLSLGIFPRIPQPAFELFVAHRHAWLPAVPGATQYKYMTSSGTVE